VADQPGFTKDGERPVHTGAVISMAVGTFVAPDGTTFERDIVHHPGAVSVVPLTEADEVLFVRQYRAALDAVLLEIPAGKRDVAGEPPEVTAARELTEEVGQVAGELTLLAEFHNSPGFSDEHSFVYLARDLTPAPDDRQGVEEQHMAVEPVPLADVPGLVASGELRDAKSIIGCLLALRAQR
jgi:ADP-ribose pyrophosphatase